MNLVIDIGNSQIKYAVFQDNLEMDYGIIQKNNLSKMDDLLQMTSISRSILSSVSNAESVKLLLQKNHIPVIELTSSLYLPFTIQYKGSETLGKDRIAGAAGATFLYPDQSILVFDIGTAMTVDMIDSGTYLGGNISPGLRLRSLALHEHTEQLPYVTDYTIAKLTGESTEEAIASGIVTGMTFEIEGYIHAYSLKYPNLVIILTGGDADFFANQLKSPIFVHSKLTLIGLNQILLKNEISL